MYIKINMEPAKMEKYFIAGYFRILSLANLEFHPKLEGWMFYIGR
jgi:hypothetical protein